MNFQLLALAFLLLRKEVVTHWLGGWVDCKTRLDAEGERKVPCPTRSEFWFHGLTNLLRNHSADWAISLILILRFHKFTYQALSSRRLEGPKCGFHYSYVIRTEVRNLRLFISTTTVIIHGVLLKIQRSDFIYWILRFLRCEYDTMRLDIVDSCHSIQG